MALAIKVQELSKAYQLGVIGTGTLSRDLERWAARMRGKEDPFLKIGETNDRTVVGKSDIVWSLRDINFDIKEGDAIGIIGRNGAGKSTLLKILSRVTAPTRGNIKIKGRMASLLEVGTGFHPELTGRENILLNGAILGMRKKEILRKFDEIVDFSGVERYIDTPVKRYSSGMYVRLAFAVAAYLESEILVVDEVLAVGDAEFQKKCLGKMNEVSKGQGRTVLFVSHNMGSVSQLCKNGILLKNGTIDKTGTIHSVVNEYLRSSSDNSAYYKVDDKPGKAVQILSAEIMNAGGERTNSFGHDEEITIAFKIKNNSIDKGIVCSLSLLDLHGKIIFADEVAVSENSGVQNHVVTLPKSLFRPRDYQFAICLHVPNVTVIETVELLTFEIVDKGSKFSVYGSVDNGYIFPHLKWNVSAATAF